MRIKTKNQTLIHDHPLISTFINFHDRNHLNHHSLAGQTASEIQTLQQVVFCIICAHFPSEIVRARCVKLAAHSTSQTREQRKIQINKHETAPWSRWTLCNLSSRFHFLALSPPVSADLGSAAEKINGWLDRQDVGIPLVTPLDPSWPLSQVIMWPTRAKCTNTACEVQVVASVTSKTLKV